MPVPSPSRPVARVKRPRDALLPPSILRGILSLLPLGEVLAIAGSWAEWYGPESSSAQTAAQALGDILQHLHHPHHPHIPILQVTLDQERRHDRHVLLAGPTLSPSGTHIRFSPTLSRPAIRFIQSRFVCRPHLRSLHLLLPQGQVGTLDYPRWEEPELDGETDVDGEMDGRTIVVTPSPPPLETQGNALLMSMEVRGDRQASPLPLEGGGNGLSIKEEGLRVGRGKGWSMEYAVWREVPRSASRSRLSGERWVEVRSVEIAITLVARAFQRNDVEEDDEGSLSLFRRLLCINVV